MGMPVEGRLIAVIKLPRERFTHCEGDLLPSVHCHLRDDLQPLPAVIPPQGHSYPQLPTWNYTEDH
jgi:hypothetical protein